MAEKQLFADEYKVTLDVFEGPLDLLLYLILILSLIPNRYRKTDLLSGSKKYGKRLHLLYQ